MNKLFLVFIITLFGLQACAQPKQTYTIKNKKAIALYEEALKDYQLFELQTALGKMKKLSDENPDFLEAHFMLAQLYDETGQTEKAIDPLTKALNLDEKYYPAGWMMLAECHFYIGQYDEAEKAITRFMPFPKESKEQEKRAQLILSSCIFAKRALANPVPFDPINLGNGVNTAENEYYPCITADEKTLLFTREIDGSKTGRINQEDFYISKKEGSNWVSATPVAEINTPTNEGAPSLSADGQTLIFTACEGGDGTWGGDRQGIGSCDLFFSTKTGNGWRPAQNLGPAVNSGAWESQPSFSANGRTLYFVRGKRTARGVKEQDIYYSYLDANNKWTPAQKVPGRINTIFEEESVMIHPDGHTLYFSSNGHSGMGGLDIYMSRMLPNGDWDAPINLGYPINTYANENSIQVSAAGNLALMASSRPGGFGGLDLYQFDLHEGARPAPVTYVEGIISDKLSFKKLEARLELIDIETGKVVTETYSGQGSGQFLLCIPTGKDYALNVNKESYLFHSENFSLKGYDKIEPYRLDIQLQKLRPGASIVLNNVFFETNQATLKPESKSELDKLVNLLKNNPDKKIEISGHTDNVGSDTSNQTLSDNRAASVVQYLISHGIPAEKLVAQGYGETMPVADNTTETGRAKNRRTEFKILE